jgi:predicted RNA binding protein YcfA (HicA-like mRNA interferase family)
VVSTDVAVFLREAKAAGWAVRRRSGGHFALSHELAADVITVPSTRAAGGRS